MSALQNIIKTFKHLGLKNTDTKVYLACLQAENGLFTHEVVKQTALNRSTVDLIIERLLSKGVLTKTREGRRNKYGATPPEALLFRQEQFLEDLKAVIPVLSKLQSQDVKTQITFYNGPEEVRHAYKTILLKLKLAQGEEKRLLSLFSGTDIFKALPDFHDFFIKKRIKMGIPIQVISTQEQAHLHGMDNSPKELRAARYFSGKQFHFGVGVEIFADSIWILSPKKPLSGVMIQNKDVAASLRNIFYMLWQFLPDVDCS